MDSTDEVPVRTGQVRRDAWGGIVDVVSVGDPRGTCTVRYPQTDHYSQLSIATVLELYPIVLGVEP